MQKDNVFKANPKLNKYFKTSDGQAFFKDHDAATHAKSLKNKEVETVNKTAAADKPTTAKEIIAMIEVAETTEAVEALAEGDERVTVIEAAYNKIEALNA